jgi:Caspase domain
MLKVAQKVVALIVGAAWMLSPTSAEAKRVALVIGNETYQPAGGAPADTRVATPVPLPSGADPLSKPQRLKDLRNPVRDAKAFAEVLKAAGYDVIDRYNLDFKSFNAALDEFAEKSAGATEAIVFFAGHGMKITQREGRTVREKNVLAPIDAEISCDLSRSSGVVIEMEKVMRAVEGVPKQVFIFDACRDDPFQHCPGRTAGTSGSGFDRAALPIGAADSATSIIARN